MERRYQVDMILKEHQKQLVVLNCQHVAAALSAQCKECEDLAEEACIEGNAELLHRTRDEYFANSVYEQRKEDL